MNVATGKWEETPVLGGDFLGTASVHEDFGDGGLALDDDFVLEFEETLEDFLLHDAVADVCGGGGVVCELGLERGGDG